MITTIMEAMTTALHLMAAMAMLRSIQARLQLQTLPMRAPTSRTVICIPWVTAPEIIASAIMANLISR